MHAFHGPGSGSGGSAANNNGRVGYDVSAAAAGRSPKSPKKFLFDAVSPRDEQQTSKYMGKIIFLEFIGSGRKVGGNTKCYQIGV